MGPTDDANSEVESGISTPVPTPAPTADPKASPDPTAASDPTAISESPTAPRTASEPETAAPEPTVAPPTPPVPRIDGEIVPENIVRAPEGVEDPIAMEPITPGEVCYVSGNGSYYYTMRTMNGILRNSTRLENDQWVSGLRNEEGNAIQALDPFTRAPISQDAINYIRPPPGRVPYSLNNGMFSFLNLIEDYPTTEQQLRTLGAEGILNINQVDYLFRWVRGNWNRYIGLPNDYRMSGLYSNFEPDDSWENVYFRPNSVLDQEVSARASGSSPNAPEGDSSNETGGTGATTDQPNETGDINNHIFIDDAKTWLHKIKEQDIDTLLQFRDMVGSQSQPFFSHYEQCDEYYCSWNIKEESYDSK